MKKEKKKGSCLKTILIIFAVFIVFGIIGSVFGKDDKKNVENDIQTAERTENETAENDEEEKLDEVETDDILSDTLPDTPTESNSPEETSPVEPQYEDGSSERSIQDYAVNVIKENYTYTDIESISVNENLGTDEPEDYVLLVRLIWNQKNSGSTSRDVLALYSEDFATRIGVDQPTVNEIAIFWTVPYLDNANAKWAYERNGEGMYQTDNMMSAAFTQ